MTAREYLRELRRMDARIGSRIRKRDEYAFFARTGTSGVRALRDSGTAARSRVEDYVCRLVDLERELDGEIDALIDARREAGALIARLPDARCRDVLTMRYLDGRRWEEIAQAMGSTVRWVLRLHGRALYEFDNIYKNGN